MLNIAFNFFMFLVVFQHHFAFVGLTLWLERCCYFYIFLFLGTQSKQLHGLTKTEVDNLSVVPSSPVLRIVHILIYILYKIDIDDPSAHDKFNVLLLTRFRHIGKAGICNHPKTLISKFYAKRSVLFLEVVCIFKMLVESTKHHLLFVYQLHLLLIS